MLCASEDEYASAALNGDFADSRELSHFLQE
jgi:hypothetical protein